MVLKAINVVLEIITNPVTCNHMSNWSQIRLKLSRSSRCPANGVPYKKEGDNSFTSCISCLPAYEITNKGVFPKLASSLICFSNALISYTKNMSVMSAERGKGERDTHYSMSRATNCGTDNYMRKKIRIDFITA